MLTKQILGCLFGVLFTINSLPTHMLAATAQQKKANCHQHYKSCSSSSSSSSSNSCSDKANEFDYIIVGLGTAGAVLARKLSDNHKNRVLVLEAGPNLSHDPVVLDPVIFNNLYELTFSPKFAETYPIPLTTDLLQAVTYSEGRMWGGSSAHNYLLAVRGTPSVYDSWALETGNSRWSYNNLLPTIRAIETYTPDGTILNPAERGTSGPIFITQNPPVDTSNLANAISTAANAPLVPDYNDPTDGNISVSSYQQFVSPPPNSQRSFAINAYLPDSVITPEGRGRHGRKLQVVSDTRVSRILFRGNKAIGVECILSGTAKKVKRAFAKKKVIVCAGAIHTPALLQRSGIGDSTLLNSLDIPVIVNNPNVGANLKNQPGAIAIITGNEPLPIQGMINASPYYPNDDVRRIQYLSNPGAGGILGYGFIMQSGSTGSVQIVSKNPFIHPNVDLNMYSDGPVGTLGTDAHKIVSYLKIMQSIAAAATATVLVPTAADYTDDNTLLEYATSNPNIIITSHISGTARMSTTALDGVVDGDLNVFGTENLMVVDLSVAPTQPDGNTCFPVYVIANEAANILGV